MFSIKKNKLSFTWAPLGSSETHDLRFHRYSTSSTVLLALCVKSESCMSGRWWACHQSINADKPTREFAPKIRVLPCHVHSLCEGVNDSFSQPFPTHSSLLSNAEEKSLCDRSKASVFTRLSYHINSCHSPKRWLHKHSILCATTVKYKSRCQLFGNKEMAQCLDWPSLCGLTSMIMCGSC